MMEEEDLSSAQAVLLGALGPGVNEPTWNTLKMAFFLLGLSLMFMLGLAFSSSDSAVVLHVGILVLIALTLFLLLSGFLQQTGLVSVGHQIQVMGLRCKDNQEGAKINMKASQTEKKKTVGAHETKKKHSSQVLKMW